MLSKENLAELLPNKFNKIIKYFNNGKYLGLVASKDDIHELIKILKDEEKLKFNQLIDITAIDYPSNEKRFCIIYIFLSLSLNQRLVIKTWINDNENLLSITNLFYSANWYERECYDLFGIKFINHPDLRRILTDYNFEGYPLRKDFPLTGHNEVRYDNLEKKVVYEPVNLPQEYRNFDYSSPWEGLPNELKGDEKADKEDL
tara:strand:- start:1565 stop:2170 length:606 start_codon:yes stop_codon:yes gene_type:complete